MQIVAFLGGAAEVKVLAKECIHLAFVYFIVMCNIHTLRNYLPKYSCLFSSQENRLLGTI